MARQLTLIEAPVVWRLDEKTRAAGRKGVAEARAALAAARRTDRTPPSHDPHRPTGPSTRRTAA